MNHEDNEIINGTTSHTPPPARGTILLSARATGPRLRISASPASSVQPTRIIVQESDRTAWSVITVTGDGVVHPCDGDRQVQYPACPGNGWIDLEVECPHNQPPTEAKPVELRGAILCEPSDLPISRGDTERDHYWWDDFNAHPGTGRHGQPPRHDEALLAGAKNLLRRPGKSGFSRSTAMTAPRKRSGQSSASSRTRSMSSRRCTTATRETGWSST